MRIRRYQLGLFLYLVLSMATAILIIKTSGVFSTGFWILVVTDLSVLALLLLYFRYRDRNEIVKCNGCGRTMTYDVFQRAGNCPKCHNNSYTRTGERPKSSSL